MLGPICNPYNLTHPRRASNPFRPTVDLMNGNTHKPIPPKPGDTSLESQWVNTHVGVVKTQEAGVMQFVWQGDIWGIVFSSRSHLFWGSFFKESRIFRDTTSGTPSRLVPKLLPRPTASQSIYFFQNMFNGGEIVFSCLNLFAGLTMMKPISTNDDERDGKNETDRKYGE